LSRVCEGAANRGLEVRLSGDKGSRRPAFDPCPCMDTVDYSETTETRRSGAHQRGSRIAASERHRNRRRDFAFHPPAPARREAGRRSICPSFPTPPLHGRHNDDFPNRTPQNVVSAMLVRGQRRNHRLIPHGHPTGSPAPGRFALARKVGSRSESWRRWGRGPGPRILFSFFLGSAKEECRKTFFDRG